MASTQTRHDDIFIQRRFVVHGSTHAVKQVYAVTYPWHLDQGTECESYGEAEQNGAHASRSKRALGVIRGESSARRATLVKSFRDSN